MVTQAMASETSGGPETSNTLKTPRTPKTPNAETRAAQTGQELVADLGTSRTAGSWIDTRGRPVVAVTDEKAAADVREAGAVAKVVRHTMRDLKSATETLKDAPKVAGTSWAMDYATNQVVVRADSTVSAAAWARLTQVAGGIGTSVRMERTDGTFTPRLNGADALFAGSGRCSAGFNVTNGQNNFILTAGHCGPVGTTWFSDQQGTKQVGSTVSGSFPGGDFSLVRYDSTAALSGADVVAVGNGQGIRIVGASDPAVGQKVFRSGSTTGLRSGQVTGLNATVNYPQGTVTGLIETTVCAEPGDSGGPMFADGLALGVTSGGSGDCKNGGTTFFQPVTKALDSLGVKLAAAPGAAGQATPSAGSTDGAGAAVPPGTSSAAPGGAALPGAMGPVDTAPEGQTDSAASVLDRLAEYRNLGPGLFLIAGSLLALVALRIRSERGRKRYRNQYSQSWG
jgi:streptogrisin D